MALYTQEGLKFDNEEVAIKWFLSTLSDSTPLGDKYEALHAHDWGTYSLQATGYNENEMHISLDKGNLKERVFKTLHYNTYGNAEDIKVEDTIKDLERFIKAMEIAHIAYSEAAYEVVDAIRNGDERYIKRFTDFDNIVTRFQIDKTMAEEIFTIGITDEETGRQYKIQAEFNEYGRLDFDKIKRDTVSLFVKSTEGKFNLLESTIGDYKIDDILGYALENDKELKLEIID